MRMSKFPLTGAALLAVTAIAVGAATPASATAFGTNLIANGDAEANTVTDFTASPGFQTLSYTYGGGYPFTGDPGVSEGGSYFFIGGDTALTTAAQVIDVSSLAAAIDAGTVGYTLSALLGGYASQDDNAALSISFLDTTSLTLGGDTTGVVTAADRNNVTAMLDRSVNGVLPTGTRSINVLLTQTRYQGSANDGYADNLSLVLNQLRGTSAVPEPATWAMMLVGFGAVGGAMRRRRRVAVHFA
jgi:hypothetical protein